MPDTAGVVHSFLPQDQEASKLLGSSWEQAGTVNKGGRVITKLFLALASLPFIASMAMAGQPVPLSDAQMDKVTAGAVTIICSGCSTTDKGTTGAVTIICSECYTTQPIPQGSIIDQYATLTVGGTTYTYHLTYPFQIKF